MLAVFKFLGSSNSQEYFFMHSKYGCQLLLQIPLPWTFSELYVLIQNKSISQDLQQKMKLSNCFTFPGGT